MIRWIIFAVLNFSALALGSILMGNGAQGEWYLSLNKAPWTPPGWVFGAAWTTIMLFFTFYMSELWKSYDEKNTLIFLFALQWILNVAWSPVFFRYQLVVPALIIILALSALVSYFLFRFLPILRFRSLLIAPYFLWLLLATSLNAFILFKNTQL